LIITLYQLSADAAPSEAGYYIRMPSILISTRPQDASRLRAG